MATKSSDKLLVSIGLDLTQLEADIAQAERTVRENLATYNREANLIKLRMQVDTASLDPVKDKTRILEIQEKALTDQLKLQGDRVKILTAEYQQMLTTVDKSSASAQRAEAALLREQLTMKNLGQQMKDLQAAKTTGGSTGDPTGGLIGKLAGADPRIASVVSRVQGLGEAASVAKGAVGELGASLLAGASAATVATGGLAAAVAAIAAATAAGLELEKTVINLAKPAIEAGDSMYVLSRRMGESVQSAASFNTTMKAIGSDTGTVLAGLDRLSKSWLTAGKDGNAATHALEHFGATMTDEKGNLLTYEQRMQQLAKAFDAAKASGQQAQLQTLLFKNGMGDLVVAIEDYADVQKQVSQQLVKSSFGNPQLAHDLKTQVNILDMQTSQLGSVFSQALMPVAAELLPQVISQLGTLTKVLNDNKDVITTVGEAFSFMLKTVAAGVSLVIDSVDLVSSALADLRKEVKELNERSIEPYVDDSSIRSFEDYMAHAHADVQVDLMNPDQQAFLGAYEEEWARVLKKRAELEARAATAAQASWADFKRLDGGADRLQTEAEIADAKKAAEARVAALKQVVEAQKAASDERIKVIDHEYAEVVRKAAAGEGGVYEAVAEWQDKVNAEYKDQLDKRLELIRAEYNAKMADAGANEAVELEKQKQAKITEALVTEQRRREQLERESADRARALTREAEDTMYGITHDGLEKTLHDVQRWKEAQLEKATTAKEVAAIVAAASAKEARAVEDEVNRIRDLNMSLEEKLFEKTHSRYQTDVYKLQKEVYEALAKGADRGLVDEYYRVAKAELDAKARGKDREYTKAPRGNRPQILVYTPDGAKNIGGGAGNGPQILERTPEGLRERGSGDTNFLAKQERMETLARQQLGVTGDIQRTTSELRAATDFAAVTGELQRSSEQLRTLAGFGNATQRHQQRMEDLAQRQLTATTELRRTPSGDVTPAAPTPASAAPRTERDVPVRSVQAPTAPVHRDDAAQPTAPVDLEPVVAELRRVAELLERPTDLAPVVDAVRRAADQLGRPTDLEPVVDAVRRAAELLSTPVDLTPVLAELQRIADRLAPGDGESAGADLGPIEAELRRIADQLSSAGVDLDPVVGELRSIADLLRTPVDLGPVINELRSIAGQQVAVDLAPVVAEVRRLADQLKPVDLTPVVGELQRLADQQVTVDLTPVVNELRSIAGQWTPVDLTPVVSELQRLAEQRVTVDLGPATAELQRIAEQQATVDFTPVVNELRNMAERLTTVDLSPVVNELQHMADRQAAVDLSPVVSELQRMAERQAAVDLTPVVNELRSMAERQAAVDLSPVVNELRSMAERQATVDLSPVVSELRSMAERQAAVDLSPVVNELRSMAERQAAVDLTPVVSELRNIAERQNGAVGVDLGPVVSELRAAVDPAPVVSELRQLPERMRGTVDLTAVTAEVQRAADQLRALTDLSTAAADARRQLGSLVQQQLAVVRDIGRTAEELRSAAGMPTRQGAPAATSVVVSPTIDVRVDGYPTEAIVREMTDDITAKVAEGVEQAARSALSQANYSYGG